MAEGEQAGAAGGTPPETAGALLRAARERQGVHLAVLAASLKVAPRKLELMEGDRFEELPDASFARALALSMCRALKIDAEPVLARLPHAQGERRLEHMTRGLNQPFRERAGGAEGGAGWRRLSLPLAGAALLVLAALLVYLLPASLWTRSEVGPELVSGPAAGTAQEPGEAGPSSGTAGAEAPPAATAAAPAEVPEAPASSAVLDTVFLAPPPEPASAPAVAAPASAPLESLLSLSASAPSWIEVRDGSDRLLFSRTLAAGETAAVDGKPPLRLTIGNAAATRVSFRGEPVTLKAGRENVARLELK